MNIKFYAPVNCIVKIIDKCTDQTFSNKFLGDGFLILPKNGNFKFPFDQGTCKMIFDTKHAYGFDVMGFDVLIHCGLETVNLKGQPFETNLNINQDLQKGQDLFIVNLDSIKKADLSIETPIVFDLEKVENFDLIDFKEGEYKQGDLICTVNIKEKELKIEDSTEDKLQKVANENYELQLKEFRTKYEIAAEYFLKCVGGPSNFSKVYNCMTRLRFTVKNKDIVDQTSIKKDKLVKGIN